MPPRSETNRHYGERVLGGRINAKGALFVRISHGRVHMHAQFISRKYVIFQVVFAPYPYHFLVHLLGEKLAKKIGVASGSFRVRASNLFSGAIRAHN